jgi:hypothetical protein
MSANPVVNEARCAAFFIAHEAAGAAGIRLSLRALYSKAQD